MRKLNKKISLATEFKKWYIKNRTHEYNSSANDFYYDVLYELLIIQEGLCAYTEFRIVDEENLKKIKNGFMKGKYTSLDFRPNIPAHLEHFDKLHKQVSAWNWDNFFSVYEHVNTKKNQLEDKYGIDNILKPDLANYDPLKYLQYDKDLHLFYPNTKLNATKKEKVKNMIVVLGLNNDFIKMKRREYLNMIKTLENYTNEIQAINQFFTAYSML